MTFKMMLLFFWKIVGLAPKRAKRRKRAGQWADQIFCILLKIGSYKFSDFLHEILGPQGHKSDGSTFFGKILIFPKKWKKGAKMGKNVFLEICAKLSH